jgi:hypothetical protein
MRIQDEVINKIKETVEKHGLKFIQNPQYNNTGTFLAIESIDTLPIFGASYNFQKGYFTLQFYPGDKEIVSCCGFTHKNCIRDDLIKTSTLNEFSDTICWINSYITDQYHLVNR